MRERSSIQVHSSHQSPLPLALRLPFSWVSETSTSEKSFRCFLSSSLVCFSSFSSHLLCLSFSYTCININILKYQRQLHQIGFCVERDAEGGRERERERERERTLTSIFCFRVPSSNCRGLTCSFADASSLSRAPSLVIHMIDFSDRSLVLAVESRVV